MQKNILISYPTMRELLKISTEEVEGKESQTYKCIKYMFDNNITLDEVYIVHTQSNNMDEVRKNNLNKTILHIMGEEIPVKYIVVNDDNFKDNFALLSSIVTNEGDIDNADEYYINTMCGKNFKKFIYPIGYFYKNVHILEQNYDPKDNTKPKNENNININYEFEMFKHPESFKKYLYELCNLLKTEEVHDLPIGSDKLDSVLKNPLKFIHDRSYLLNDGYTYDKINTSTAIKNAINSFNYLYAYETTSSCSKNEEIIKILNDLYYDSVNAYDVVEHYFHGYLCYDILLHKKQPLLAINEVENLINADFYNNFNPIPKVNNYNNIFLSVPFNNQIINDKIKNNIDNVIKEELESISKATIDENNMLFLNYMKRCILRKGSYLIKNFKMSSLLQPYNELSIDEMVNKINNSKSLRSPIKDKPNEPLYNVAKYFYQMLKDNNVLSVQDKLYCLDQTLKVKVQSNCSKNNKYKFNAKTNEYRNYLSINAMSNNLLKTYELIYTFNSNLLDKDDSIITRNYYLNILNDFKNHDHLHIFDLIYNQPLIYKKEIKDYVHTKYPTLNLNDYLLNLILSASEDEINIAYNRLAEIATLKKVFKNIRNNYTHEEQDVNIYNIDIMNETRNFLNKIGIKNDNNSLLKFLEYFNDTYFNFFKIDGQDAIEYINDFITNNIDKYITNIKEEKGNNNNENSSCIIALLSEKNPHFYGCFSSTLSILLNRCIDGEFVDSIYYLVTKEYEESENYNTIKNDILKSVEEINPQIQVNFISIKNLNISLMSNKGEIEHTNEPITYNIDNCFKICLTIYNQYIKNNSYKKVIIDTSGGLAQFSNALSLLRYISNNIVCYDCSQDYHYYTGLLLDRSKVKMPRYETRKETNLPILVKQHESLSFVNIVNLCRDSLKNYNFNSLYFNLQDSIILNKRTKIAINYLYQWINGNTETLTDPTMSLNDELYINILANIELYLKNENYELAALLSGYIIETIIKSLFETVINERLLIRIKKDGSKMLMNSCDYNDNYLDEIIDIYKKYLEEKKIFKETKDIDHAAHQNKNTDEFNVLTSNYWLGLLTIALKKAKHPNKLTKFGEENLINIYNLYWTRNSLIHKGQKNCKYDENTSPTHVKNGFKAIYKYIEIVGKDKKLDKIREKYQKQIDIIGKEVRDKNE